MYQCKKESTIILGCIFIIIIFFVLLFLIKQLNKIDLFSDNKRGMMKKISKIKDGHDPDEITVDNPYDDLCNDPDGNCSFD